MFNLKLKTYNLQLKKGQATLEITVALVAVFTLLLGSTKILVWLNERMVLRQEAYESSRVAAGRTGSGVVEVDESGFPELDIFGVNTEVGAGSTDPVVEVVESGFPEPDIFDESGFPELDIFSVNTD